jgi:Skp family chaperone for outer membrane proteins
MAWNKGTDTVAAARYLGFALAVALAVCTGQAAAATPAAASDSIYTCIDSKGHRLTADRPIPDCIDREQTELSPGGLTRRKIGPSLTAAERAAQEEQDRRQAEERARAEEEKRKQRALLVRFPNQETHDKERADALALVDSVTAAAQRRTEELQRQRRFLERELEFYQLDPSKTPPKLKRQVEEIDTQLAAQKRFIVDQDVEKVRVNARFDEELARLKVLWAQQAAGVQPPVANAAGHPASGGKAAAKH